MWLLIIYNYIKKNFFFNNLYIFIYFQIPATYDSEGVGRILVKHLDYQWIPVIDTSNLNKNKDEDFITNQLSETKYWAVGMTEKHLLCVILKVII